MSDKQVFGDNISVKIDRQLIDGCETTMNSFHEKVLQHHLPAFLFDVCHSVEPHRQKFQFTDIDKIDVIKFQDVIFNNEWGVGLHVTLLDGRHFIVYLAFQDAQIHEWLDGYWEEVHESLDVVDAGCDVVPKPWYRGCDVVYYKFPW